MTRLIDHVHIDQIYNSNGYQVRDKSIRSQGIGNLPNDTCPLDVIPCYLASEAAK